MQINTGKLYELVIKWKGERCDVLHFNVSDFSKIPEHLIEKVHGVCFCDDKLLIVYHSEWDIWGIPGGTREKKKQCWKH